MSTDQHRASSLATGLATADARQDTDWINRAPTQQLAANAMADAQRIWHRALPCWASDCLILQARNLRNLVWTPLSDPADWNVEHDLNFTAAAKPGHSNEATY